MGQEAERNSLICPLPAGESVNVDRLEGPRAREPPGRLQRETEGEKEECRE
jgi:hypothetical protein